MWNVAGEMQPSARGAGRGFGGYGGRWGEGSVEGEREGEACPTSQGAQQRSEGHQNTSLERIHILFHSLVDPLRSWICLRDPPYRTHWDDLLKSTASRIGWCLCCKLYLIESCHIAPVFFRAFSVLTVLLVLN